MFENRHEVFAFDGRIWALYTDPAQPGLVLEIRSKEKKSVSFYTLNFPEKQLNRIELPSEEPWLWGIETVRNNIVLFHSYKHDSSPEHCYMIAYSLSDGEKIWENYTHAFQQSNGNTIAAYPANIEPRRYEYFDLLSGKNIDIQGTEEKILYPNILPERKHTPETIDFIEYKNFQISSYLRANKLVWEVKNTLNPKLDIYTAAIDSDIFPEETFLIYADCLIFIQQNNSELHTYYL